ncbi:MAG: DNA gyrase inhibitor YacG [Rhodocyclaceae bacterium]|nr:DNA gyrase inhibitor YacG [Rhodocyclaceae bacterium]
MADRPDAAAAAPRMVKCPQCGQPALWAPDNRWRPFCSERCRQIDLGAWASDQYRVAGSEPAGDSDPGAEGAA